MTLPDWLREAGAFEVGGKIYIQCARCHSIIRVNKPIFGALHLCD